MAADRPSKRHRRATRAERRWPRRPGGIPRRSAGAARTAAAHGRARAAAARGRARPPHSKRDPRRAGKTGASGRAAKSTQTPPADPGRGGRRRRDRRAPLRRRRDTAHRRSVADRAPVGRAVRRRHPAPGGAPPLRGATRLAAADSAAAGGPIPWWRFAPALVGRPRRVARAGAMVARPSRAPGSWLVEVRPSSRGCSHFHVRVFQTCHDHIGFHVHPALSTPCWRFVGYTGIG